MPRILLSDSRGLRLKAANVENPTFTWKEEEAGETEDRTEEEASWSRVIKARGQK